jgi:hypothetical protein
MLNASKSSGIMVLPMAKQRMEPTRFYIMELTLRHTTEDLK